MLLKKSIIKTIQSSLLETIIINYTRFDKSDLVEIAINTLSYNILEDQYTKYITKNTTTELIDMLTNIKNMLVNNYSYIEYYRTPIEPLDKYISTTQNSRELELIIEAKNELIMQLFDCSEPKHENIKKRQRTET